MRQVRRVNVFLGLLALVLMQACAERRPADCLLSSQKPMIVAELFFGRDREGRSDVSEGEWASFVDSVVARQFPDGFTVLNGKGAWFDGWLDATRYESSKILMIVTPPTPALAARLRAVADAYRRRFHQQSVGVLTTQACGAF